MKTTIILAFSLMLTIEGVSQTYITQVKPYGKKEWGYVNQDGELVIDPIYRKCYEFSEDGLAPIYARKTYSFINTSGVPITTEIKDFQLSQIFGFGLLGYQNGMVPVMKGKKWGFLNTDGELVIELKYDKVTSFDDGFAVVKIGNVFFIINKNGEETKVLDPSIIVIKHFSEGLAPYNDSKKKNGFLNINGEVVISAKYLSVGYFVAGLAWAKTLENKIGYIDKSGAWVIEPQFAVSKDFDLISGLARIKKNDRWGYTDKSGKIMYMNDCENMGDFSEGLAKGMKNGKVGYFNPNGEWAIAPEFDGGRNFKNGFAAVKKGKKWGFINILGEWIIEPTYSNVKDMERIN